MPDSRDVVSAEQVTRLLIRLVGAAVLFLFAAAAGTLVSRSDEGTFATESVARGPDSTSIGPLPGTDIGRYALDRRSALAATKDRAVAVVSLASYVEEGEARALVKRSGSEVQALLVAAPNGEAQAVTDGIEEFLKAEKTRAEAERDELVGILKTTTDPDFVAQYRLDIERLKRLVARLSSARDLVFGVVVTGDATALQALADDPDVRLLDVGVGTSLPPLAELRGLRPEETTRTGEPRSRPDL